jgi:hypothetical protein
VVIPARKRWGQHFLARGETAERIVAAARLAPSDTVLEVGPGEGALTRPIAAIARRVLAIEIDPWRAAVLEEEFAAVPGVRIARGDALARPFGSGWQRRVGSRRRSSSRTCRTTPRRRSSSRRSKSRARSRAPSSRSSGKWRGG